MTVGALSDNVLPAHTADGAVMLPTVGGLFTVTVALPDVSVAGQPESSESDENVYVVVDVGETFIVAGLSLVEPLVPSLST